MGNFNQQGNLEEAIEAYNKAIAIKPDYADAYAILTAGFPENILHRSKRYFRVMLFTIDSKIKKVRKFFMLHPTKRKYD